MSLFPTPDPTYPEYAALRDAAEQRTGQFVDPVDVNRRIPELVRRRGHDWAFAVLGRPYHGVGSLYGPDMELLKLADELGLEPPLPADVVARRAAAREREEAESRAWLAMHERIATEWAALRAALPVPVEVFHNYTSARHVDGFSQGADHIILSKDLRVGRLSRERGLPLCFVPSRAKDLQVFDDPGEHRRPTCKACIRTACRITRLDAPTMLNPRPVAVP